MEDELKRVELETAKLRLERERLELDEARGRRARNERVAEATREAVKSTVAIGADVASAGMSTIGFLLMLLLRLLGWACLGAILCAILVLVFRKDFPGSFEYRFGSFLGSGGYMVILIGCIVGLLMPKRK